MHSSKLSFPFSPSTMHKLLSLSKSFQNLNVSSADAVHIVELSGDCAMWSTLCVWPYNYAIFLQLGSESADLLTFHTQSWFSTYPCELTNYFYSLFHNNEHTWLYVFISFNILPVSMFQSRRVLSADPPPVANKFLCQGHQARAFTAALCPSK